MIELFPDSAATKKTIPFESRNAKVTRDYLNRHVPALERIVGFVEWTDRSLPYGLQNLIPANLLWT